MLSSARHTHGPGKWSNNHRLLHAFAERCHTQCWEHGVELPHCGQKTKKSKLKIPWLAAIDQGTNTVWTVGVAHIQYHIRKLTFELVLADSFGLQSVCTYTSYHPSLPIYMEKYENWCLTVKTWSIQCKHFPFQPRCFATSSWLRTVPSGSATLEEHGSPSQSMKSIRKRRGSYSSLLVGWNCDGSPNSTFLEKMSCHVIRTEDFYLLKDGWCHDTSPSADEVRWFHFTIMILELKSPPIHQTNGPTCTRAPHFGIFVPLQHLNKLKLCTTSPATRTGSDQSCTCRWTMVNRL